MSIVTLTMQEPYTRVSGIRTCEINDQQYQYRPSTLTRGKRGTNVVNMSDCRGQYVAKKYCISSQLSSPIHPVKWWYHSFPPHPSMLQVVEKSKIMILLGNLGLEIVELLMILAFKCTQDLTP